MSRGVCAVVLDYADTRRTARCVRSLINQSIDSLYVVDNTGSGAHAGELESLLDELRSAGFLGRLSVVVSRNNRGFGGGVNDAVLMDQRAGGHDAYLLLNDDAVLDEHAVDRLYQVLTGERTGLAAGRVVTSGQEFSFLWYQRWFGHVSMRRLPGSFPYVPGTCLLVDQTLVSGSGIFDPAFFMYGEDIELSWRAALAGLAARCADDVLVRHEGSASAVVGSLFYEYHVARGHVLLVRRLARGSWQMPIMYAGRFAYLTARALVRAVRHRSLTPLFAAVAAWIPYSPTPPETPAAPGR